jgi:hypothetical protein
VPVGLEQDVVDRAGELEELRAKEHKAGVGLGIGVDDEDPTIFPRQPRGNVQGTRRFPDAALIVDHRDHTGRNLGHEFIFP